MKLFWCWWGIHATSVSLLFTSILLFSTSCLCIYFTCIFIARIFFWYSQINQWMIDFSRRNLSSHWTISTENNSDCIYSMGQFILKYKWPGKQQLILGKGFISFTITWLQNNVVWNFPHLQYQFWVVNGHAFYLYWCSHYFRTSR